MKTLALFFVAASVFAQELPVPKHLELARELVATVKPENNMYVHSTQRIQWKGDLFTSENSVHTTCGGFVRGVLERADESSVSKVWPKSVPNRNIHLADWVEAGNSGRVKRIQSLSNVQPGDLFIFLCLDKETCKTSQGEAEGHITFVDAKPEKAVSKAPILEGTEQWNLTVIDSADSAHDRNDTRFVPKGEKKITGVGRGTFRIYTDASGIPVGYAKGFVGANYHSIADRPITITRPE
jgi:hypothetical protein